MSTSVWKVCPETESSSSTDPSLQLAQIALAGYAHLAADSLLRKENHGKVHGIIEKSIALLDQSFRENKAGNRERCVEVLLEIALNFLGMERKRAGFSDQETDMVLSEITKTLQSWEIEDGESAGAVVEHLLEGMKMVLSGKGMVAKMAEEIESSLTGRSIASSFVESSRTAIRDNVYYQIVDAKLSKFGNDSATGLRWARHLGAVQVSSNPVIAARAYDEIADLWNRFRVLASSHSEWQRDPENLADEIALYGTVISLLPNILDFRPVALLSDFEDGMVSIQINPQKASDVEGSLKDALKFQAILKDILKVYDAHLTGSKSPCDGRPNIVFKVSTCGIEAIRLTEQLDRIGIGTNNTVTFTVAQEIEMSLTAMKGLASALKAGIPISTIYITNMEGRLEDHLREVQAAKFLGAALEKSTDKEIEMLTSKIGAVDDVRNPAMPLDQKIKKLCGKKYLKSLVDGWFLDAVGQQKGPALKQMEEDIRLSGVYVTRRVFELLFHPSTKPNLVKYIREAYDLSDAEATKIVDSVDLLPASKRRAEDTYLVLADSRVSNLTNTEFPDQQLKVLVKSREPGIKLADFEDSIASQPDRHVLERLLQMEDFRKAYELNPHLVGELSRIGIQVLAESAQGLESDQWASYGPVIKTMDEFNAAYLSFRRKLLSFVAKPPPMEKEITAEAKVR